MNRPLSTVLHPMSFEFGAHLSGTAARHAQTEQWRRIHGGHADAPPMRLLAEHPLVASQRLQTALDVRVAQLLEYLTPRFAVAAGGLSLKEWRGIQGPDVVSADMAIVADPDSPEGWSLRWVEFQAFASISSTIYTMHLGAAELWQGAGSLRAWRLPEGASDWLTEFRRWAAPREGILLERSPHEQLSRFDLQAASHFLRLPLVDPCHLRRSGSLLTYQDASGHHDVDHIFNRLVMHELADRPQFERLAVGCDLTWHSHPAWYYGLSKAWMPELPQANAERCVMAPHWRELGLPADALVAKNCHSHGGAAVHLHVTPSQLDALPCPADWVVQPRYTPQGLFEASDGQPIFGEIRCVLALPAGEAPWLATQMLRLSRGSKSSASAVAEAPGSGFTLLYRPPEI